MGCSIKERGKVWKMRGFTDDYGCGMIFMLGGFCGSRPLLISDSALPNPMYHSVGPGGDKRDRAAVVCLPERLSNNEKDQPFGWSWWR